MATPPLASRRFFLKIAGSSVAIASLGILGSSSTRADQSDDVPLFRFVQWNDLHVDARKPSTYLLANDKAAWLIDWINSPDRASRYDFVAGIGDLIQGGNLKSLAADTEHFKRMVEGLAIPLRPAVGNHENVAREGDPIYEKSFCEAFGLKETNYSFRHKGVLFVMLNTSGGPRTKGTPVRRRRNAWFREVLEASRGTPKIVCCHVPLLPVRDEAVLAKSFGYSGPTAGDDELLGLVDEHADSIAAVLSGHLHLTGTVQRKGVHHIAISGTASYPCDFATYDVFPDRIRVRIRSLPDELVTPQTNLHGKPRHKNDYIDAAHPTHDAYMKGVASERDFDMELRPSLK